MKAASILVLSLLASQLAHADPTLLVNASGVLTGARGVIVEGNSYDVTFADGTCAGVFGNCDVSSFAFQTATSADAAALALLQTVLTDSAAGQFDTNPGLVFGCDPSPNACNTLVPYAVNGPFVITRAVSNVKNDLVDLPVAFQLSFRPATFDSSNTPGTGNNFAVFSLASPVPPVPDAPAAALMSVGLLFLGLTALRRRHALHAEADVSAPVGLG